MRSYWRWREQVRTAICSRNRKKALPLATPIFRKRHQKSYLCRVRLVRCEIFADSSLLGGLFYLPGLLFPRPPPEGPLPPPCPVGHPAPFLSFCGCAILGLLLLGLTIVSDYSWYASHRLRGSGKRASWCPLRTCAHWRPRQLRIR